MGTEKHVIKVDGVKREFHTCTDFWECECEKAFYHLWTEKVCPKCNAESDMQPDATVEELLAILNSPYGGKESQSVVHNIANMVATALDELQQVREAVEVVTDKEGMDALSELTGSLVAISALASAHGWED